MNGERWRQVRALFAAARAQPVAERAAFLADACGSDGGLRQEVEKLLQAEAAAGGFLESPAQIPATAFPTATSAAVTAALAPGGHLGPYEVLGLVGAGGMGEVFRARDTRLDRTVAIKVLPAELAADPARRQRFEREARLVAALAHPHICTLHDVGHADGRDFLVMEYLEGETLAAVLGRGPLPLDKVLRWGVQIAEALEEAHRHGIVHRDLKPANVMVTRGGVKLLDFGLAKLREPASASGEAPTRAAGDLTASGVVMGTMPYMAPEQLAGEATDARTDVFALGAVLYEMTTGRRAFEGKTRAELMRAILHDQPPPLVASQPAAPPGLERIVRTCLSKEPDARWQTAREVALALGWVSDPALSGPSSGPSPAVVGAERRPAALAIALAGAALVTLLVLGALLLRERGRERAPAAARPTALTMTPLTSGGRAASGELIDGELTISPDGKYLAFVTLDDHQRTSLWVRLVSGASEVRVAPAEDGKGDFGGTTFSPESDEVWFVGSRPDEITRSLYRVPVLGGRVQRVVEDAASPVTFSPDGTRIAFVRELPERLQTELVVARRDGSDARVIARRSLDRALRPEGCDWSPDGKLVACGVAEGGAGVLAQTVLGFPLDGGAPVPLTPTHWSSVHRVLWLRDGSGMVITAEAGSSPIGTQLYFLPWPAAPARRITDDIDGYGGVSLGLTADGRTIATIRTRSASSRLWIVPVDGGEQAARPLPRTGDAAGILGLAWGHDGRLVYTALTGARTDLWSVASDGSDPRPITDDDATEAYPSPSADGRTLVFQSDRGGRWQLWRTDADGSRPAVLFDEAVQEARPWITSDSRWVIFAAFFGNRVGLWRLPLAGGAPTRLLDRPALTAGASPDGRQIAYGYIDEKTRQPKLAIMPFAGGAPERVLDMPKDAAPGRGGLQWLPDGRAVCFARDQPPAPNLWCQPLDGSPPRQLTHFGNEFLHAWAFSPDGRQVVVSRGIENSDLVLIRDFR